eukprot:2728840-Prymnesium_polylepis.2
MARPARLGRELAVGNSVGRRVHARAAADAIYNVHAQAVLRHRSSSVTRSYVCERVGLPKRNVVTGK